MAGVFMGWYDVVGAARPSFIKVNKTAQFGVDFDLKILVDNCIPHRKITGKIVVETSFPIKHEGILIQLEAICTLRYATKRGVDDENNFSEVVIHEGRQPILENTKPEVNGFQESPVRHVILTGNLYDWVNHSLNTGKITYPPFSIEIPENVHFPAPFKNNFGNLNYRLAVYMKPLTGGYVEVGEKVITQTFRSGHHNLFYNPASMKPISLESFCKKSAFFSPKKLVEVGFSVNNSGYLSGERISFALKAKNPQCLKLQLKVELIKQTKYEANKKRSCSKINKLAIIAMKDREETEASPELAWEDALELPMNLEPSFTGHPMYNVIYYIQFIVKVVGHGVAKGKAPIFIGTMRDSVRMSDASLLNVPIRALRRLGIASSRQSIRSSASAATNLSLPPAYSQLSSRISSVETMPPEYEDACSDHLQKMKKESTATAVTTNNLRSPVGRQDTVIIEEEAELQLKSA